MFVGRTLPEDANRTTGYLKGKPVARVTKARGECATE